MRLSLLPTTVLPVALLLLPSALGLRPAGTVSKAIQPPAHPKFPRGPSATIKGLLQIRQTSTCDPGFHACDAVSCCRNDQDCVPGGCCPKGSICTGQSDRCTDPSLVLCPDKSGCCDADETCVKDSTGATVCQEGGGGGGGGGGIDLTSTPTTSRVRTTSSIGLNPPPTTTPSIPNMTTNPGSNAFPTTTPGGQAAGGGNGGLFGGGAGGGATTTTGAGNGGGAAAGVGNGGSNDARQSRASWLGLGTLALAGLGLAL